MVASMRLPLRPRASTGASAAVAEQGKSQSHPGSDGRPLCRFVPAPQYLVVETAGSYDERATLTEPVIPGENVSR